MNLNFQITAGEITQDDGTVITDQAFAGNDSRPEVNPDHIQGRNNPAYVALHKIGPLPPGVYRFGPWGHHPGLGDHVASLTQIEGETYGRNAFYMHGASSVDPLNSSEGCVVVPHGPRVQIEQMDPDTLTVTP
jgi:hypothetical protein